jgi:hypothetical protein
MPKRILKYAVDIGRPVAPSESVVLKVRDVTVLNVGGACLNILAAL